MSLNNCKLISLPKISDPRGNLTYVEDNKHVPFSLQRAYYLYDVPSGSIRAGHAHKKLQQLMIAIAGSFDVLLDDGQRKIKYQLNRPDCGLYICSMIWREIDNFSSGAVCLVLASELYDEADYYRNYDDFLSSLEKNYANSLR